MRRIARLVLLAAVGIVPAIASAQPSEPTEPTGSADTERNTSVGGGGTGAIDEAHVKELVDKELAKILNDRAARDAAERAAREDQALASTPSSPSDLTGSSGFMDTRLAFTLTNENVLVQPGQTIPSVPGWRFGTPNSLGVLFFDNYDTRYSGFETMSHAVMYRDFHKGHFDAETAFVLRINELSQNNISLSDDGSYIVLSDWKDPDHVDPTRVSLTVFPVSADRFRLGYSYRLSWGGDPEYAQSGSATPGAKLQYDTTNGYAFIGAKSAVILDERTAEDKSAMAVLAGAGFDPTPMVRLEANGGYFDRGYNELVDVDDQKVRLFGGSAQIAIHDGMPVQSSLDYKLYRYNNERVSGLFDPVKYPGGISWLAMSEFTVMGQTLKDPEKTGATDIQMGMAGDVNVRVMIDRWRLRFDASYRDLAFILHSTPSLPTFEDFPSDYKTSPDLFAAVGLDRNWNDFLTLGAVAGIEKPATLTSPDGIPGGMTGVGGTSTAVIRNDNVNTIITILPAGKDAVPQLAIKGTAKLTFGRIYSALLEVFYSYDGNQTTYQRVGCTSQEACPTAPFQYVFGQFNQLGVNATLQARF
jgi:opacity protein-like surface antigen